MSFSSAAFEPGFVMQAEIVKIDGCHHRSCQEWNLEGTSGLQAWFPCFMIGNKTRSKVSYSYKFGSWKFMCL